MTSLSSQVSRWRADSRFAPQIAAWRTFPARTAQLRPLPDGLHPTLLYSLRRAGIAALYSHQAMAWQKIQAGCHLVVATGTASGKTLCYNLPVLDRLMRESDARALYLFPTKALAQDQKSTLDDLVAGMEDGCMAVPIATYDGDTPVNARRSVRLSARVVISNPDMVHTGILPHHTLWADYFRNLQFVVIDEMHTYRGVFGSHVANVLRRLKRIARFYGAYPQFILTSATIANPVELAERLIEEPVVLVGSDGSARGVRHFCIYNPPLVNRELGIRRSALLESVRLAGNLLRNDVQTIVFARARRTVELIVSYLRRRSANAGDAVRGYRSGYLPRHRREIEQGLREGTVRTVVATSALELGIDIGGMEAAILTGYPGTIAATWQQAGRAGRKETESLAVLVVSSNPLDQFLAGHPDYFFGRTPERALINPDNLLILLAHLRCAAFELPFRTGETFGSVASERVAEILQFLQEAGVIHHSDDRYFWMADQYPAEDVSLRCASPEAVLLRARDGEVMTTVGEVDLASAHWMVHPRAIYLHEGQVFEVDRLDLEGRIADLRRVNTDYYTEPRSETAVRLLEKFAEEAVAGAVKAQGEIAVTTQVVGFRKVRWFTHEVIGEGEVALPPVELVTTGYWLALTDDAVANLRGQGLWSNDPNDYGPNWPAQRERARARDGYRCQVCRAPEMEAAHHVHHRIPFRAFASPEQAKDLANLITLCPRCQRRAATPVQAGDAVGGLA